MHPGSGPREVGTYDGSRRLVKRMSDLCIICAAPRSGTTLLGEAVTTAYDAGYPGEIFLDKGIEDNDDPDEGNFFRFRAQAIAQQPELLSPKISARRELLDLYLDNIRTLYPNDKLLLDVKYTSWHHLDGFWRFPTESPGLIELVRERGIPVVHLIRRNLFALYCSLKVAMQSGCWHRKLCEPEAPAPTLRIDLEGCHRWMASMASIQNTFAQWLCGIPVHTLTYEHLVQDGRFVPEVSEVFTKIFQQPPLRELSIAHAKLLPPLCHVVENPEAVVEYFDGTEFGIFVKPALEYR